ERGVTEPEATFSACFGEPFLPLAPSTYARMLGNKIDQHNANVFLVNTGWTGGPYGVGERIKLAYTRAMVHAALEGELNSVETTKDEFFGLEIPLHVPGVPDEVLIPRNTMSDKDQYDEQSKTLAMEFHHHLKKCSYVNQDIAQELPTYTANYLHLCTYNNQRLQNESHPNGSKAPPEIAVAPVVLPLSL